MRLWGGGGAERAGQQEKCYKETMPTVMATASWPWLLFEASEGFGEKKAVLYHEGCNSLCLVKLGQTIPNKLTMQVYASHHVAFYLHS